MDRRLLLPVVTVIVAVIVAAVWLGMRRTEKTPESPALAPVGTAPSAPVTEPQRRARQVVPSARRQKTYNFGTESTAESRAQLQEMLTAVDSGKELQMAEAVSRMPSLETNELLEFAAKTYATTNEPGYRRDVVLGLREQNTRRVLPLLAQAARDADPEVRSAALQVLGAAFDAGRAAELERQSKEEAAAEPEEELTEEELKEAETAEKEAEIDETLTEDDNQQIVDVLLAALADEDPDVRAAALDAIKHLDGDIQYTTLQNALGSAYPEVQMGALRLLFKADNKDAMELILAAMESDNEQVAEEAALHVNHKLTQDFESAADAKAWWDKNADNFDYDMTEIQSEPLDIDQVLD
ncbi:MAG: hypothetical protein IKS83_06530 [Victivallales bacterium]|nr:hypothetical protein [Victivallales bacterium]